MGVKKSYTSITSSSSCLNKATGETLIAAPFPYEPDPNPNEKFAIFCVLRK